jgi:hypothetical protein
MAARGMVAAAGKAAYRFRITAIYAPVPTKRAPPKQTRPVKLAKKSKPRASRAYTPKKQIILCQYILGAIKGATSNPIISAARGAIRNNASFGEETA